MGWLKFVFGGLLMLAGIFGIIVAVVGTLAVGAIAALEGITLSLWPAVGIGIFSLIVFLSGAYLVRS